MRNHHSLSRSSYGSVKFDSNDEIHELEGTDSLDDLTDIAPMLKDTNKRWSVIEKLDRRYYCRVRSCDDCLHIMNWKCLIATAMLLFFMVLAYEFARLVFFQSLSQISHYDFIVVGAGPSGSLVARRLVDAGARVLLLEAGNATQYDLGGTDYFGGPLTRFDIPLLWPSIAHTKDFRWNNFGDFDPLIAKGLGGCGIHNAMLYVRALREDVIKWNIPGWTWEIVLDIYKKLETYRPPPGEAVPWYRGTNGAISSTKPTYVDQIAPEFVSAATQLGIPLTQDFNDPDDGRHGVGFYEMNIKDGVRSSAAKEFLGPLIKNKVPNFYLEVGATVRRVILAKKFRKKGQVKKKNVSAVGDDVELYSFQAVGIEYEKNGIIHKAFLTRSVTIKNQFQRQPCIVLTAGAIMTPKILMNSGIGPKHALVEAGVTMKVRNENVGKNLQDHPAVGITAYITPTLAASYPSFYSFGRHFSVYLDAVMKSREVQQNFDHNTRKMLRKNKNKRGNTEKNVDRLVEVSGNSIETGPVPNEYFGVFSSPGFSAGAFLKSPFAVDKVPDIQLTVFPTQIEPHLVEREWTVNATTLEDLARNNQMLIVVSLLTPDARRELILNATDRIGYPPVFQLPFDSNGEYLSEKDLEKLVWGIKRARDILNTRPMSLLTREEIEPGIGKNTDEELKIWIKEKHFSNSHWVGTARAGNNAGMVIEVKQYQPMKEAKLYDYDDSNSKNKDEPVASDAFDKISVDKGKDLDVNVVNDTNADSVDSSEHDLDNDDATVEYLYVRSDFVVDERLRVHGVRNLKVADASAIPAIPNGNVHSTVLVMASMAVDYLMTDKD